MEAVPAAGWFPDPSNPGGFRWWDGAAWTDHVVDSNPEVQQPAFPQPEVVPVQIPEENTTGVEAPVVLQGPPPVNLAPYVSEEELIRTPGSTGYAAVHKVQVQHRINASRSGTRHARRAGKATAFLGLVLFLAIGVGLKYGAAEFVGGLYHSTSGIKLTESFATPDGKFSMMLPSKPEHEQQTQMVSGYPLTFDMYSSALGRDRGMVGIGYYDYDKFLKQLPASKQSQVRASIVPTTLLNDATQGALAATKGTLERSAPTTVGGYQALDVKIKPGEPGVAEARLIYAQDRMVLYMIIVVTRDGDKNLFEDVAKSIKTGSLLTAAPTA